MHYPFIGTGTLRDLMVLKDHKRERFSSYDRSGGNDDRLHIMPGEKKIIADIKGPGAIKHIWFTLDSKELLFLKKVIFRAYWDDENSPSIEVPIGDFFGAGSGKTTNFVSLPIQMSPEDGKGFNCWFPMPFKNHGVIEIESQCSLQEVLLYYYVDYELWKDFPDNLGYFHSQWRRCVCKGMKEIQPSNEQRPFTRNEEFEFVGYNTTGENNYILLDAEGKGHYVGCIYTVHNLRNTNEWNWYGEGDDMIFIDGEKWPPSLHGTGTEDYFNTAWCPQQQYSAPYHGIVYGGGENWSGTSTLYRFHIEDPVYFERSIKVTFEHGHNNQRYDDISSVVYWYQTEPHKKFSDLPDVLNRLPFPE